MITTLSRQAVQSKLLIIGLFSANRGNDSVVKRNNMHAAME